MKWEISALPALPCTIRRAVDNALFNNWFLMIFFGPEPDVGVATKSKYRSIFPLIISPLSFNWSLNYRKRNHFYIQKLLCIEGDSKKIYCTVRRFFIPFVLGKDVPTGRRHWRWCKTCILSCNCSSHEFDANHRIITCLDSFTRKFSLHSSQMLTSVQQLWRSHSLQPILNSFIDRSNWCFH